MRASDRAALTDTGVKGVARVRTEALSARDTHLRAAAMPRSDAATATDAATLLTRRVITGSEALNARDAGTTNRKLHRADQPRAVGEYVLRTGAVYRRITDAASARDTRQGMTRVQAAHDTATAATTAAGTRALARRDQGALTEADTGRTDAHGAGLRLITRTDAAQATDTALPTRTRLLHHTDTLRAGERAGVSKTLTRADRGRALDAGTRRQPLPERSYAVINERTGPYLRAFSGHGSNELTLLPATSAREDGSLDYLLSGEELGLALASAALSSLPITTDLAELMVAARVDGVLPARLYRDGSRAGTGDPDEEMRAALWAGIGFAQAARTLALAPGQDAAFLQAADDAAAYAAALTDARGLASVGGTDMLRETALAGLTLMAAGRACGNAGHAQRGMRVLEALTDRFRSPTRPTVYAASVSGPRASLAADAEGLALAGLLALAYDFREVPDELLADLERAAAAALVPWGSGVEENQPMLMRTTLVVGAGEPETRLDAEGYGVGTPGSLSGRATALVAAFQARAQRHGHARATVRGLSGMRVPYGPFSHAVKAEAREPDLSLGASIALEFTFDPRFLA